MAQTKETKQPSWLVYLWWAFVMAVLKQLWVAGTLSPRARKEMESRGWQIQENSEARLAP